MGEIDNQKKGDLCGFMVIEIGAKLFQYQFYLNTQV